MSPLEAQRFLTSRRPHVLQVVKRGSGWSNAAPGGQTRRQVVKRAVLQALANGPGEALDRGGRGNPATSETSGISDESRMNLG